MSGFRQLAANGREEGGPLHYLGHVEQRDLGHVEQRDRYRSGPPWFSLARIAHKALAGHAFRGKRMGLRTGRTIEATPALGREIAVSYGPTRPFFIPSRAKCCAYARTCVCPGPNHEVAAHA